jgi:glycosyltransferase involved in cell wall biosynthesis
MSNHNPTIMDSVASGHQATVAVVLPAYNEELTIEATIRAFHAELPHASMWVIDNKSNDATQQIACQAIASLGCSGGVIFEGRKGKGNAVRRAFRDVQADIYVLADADLTYPANRVHDMIAPILTNTADLVVGDRHSGGHYGAENKRSLHGFGNRLVRGLVNRLFDARLEDIMSGYRVFNRLFVKNYPILVEGFEIETDMTLHALDKRFRILEIPVEYKDRPAGSVSKLNTLSDGLRVLFTIARILRYYRTLVFFGGASVLLGSAGFIAAIPVFMDWIAHSYIYHLPLAILATGLEIVAVIMFAIGLILDSISHQNKCLFESEMLKRK